MPEGSNVVEDTEDELELLQNPQTLWRYWHNKLGHAPTNRIRNMANIGDLARVLASCRAPICPSCHFGKGTRKPWRTKTPNNQINVRKIIKPGYCVSIDQLESSTQGLIAQMKGSLTARRYKVMTVFVDHFSDLTYLHAQQSTTAQETIDAKKAFERYAQSHGVSINHYHADNGRFAERQFMSDVAAQGQTITFCGQCTLLKWDCGKTNP